MSTKVRRGIALCYGIMITMTHSRESRVTSLYSFFGFEPHNLCSIPTKMVPLCHRAVRHHDLSIKYYIAFLENRETGQESGGRDGLWTPTCFFPSFVVLYWTPIVNLSSRTSDHPFGSCMTVICQKK
jgi:hypothetical protein